MKTRFALAILALTSTLAFSTFVMTASNPAMREFNVTIRLTSAREVETNSGLATAINSDDRASTDADINFGIYETQANSALITDKSTAGIGEGLNTKCSKNTPFSIDPLPQNSRATTARVGVMTGVNLNNGSHSDTVKYQLHRPTTPAGVIADSGFHTPEPRGSDKGIDTVDLIGRGLNDVIKAPACTDVPAGELDKTPGRYQDRVTASVSY